MLFRSPLGRTVYDSESLSIAGYYMIWDNRIPGTEPGDYIELISPPLQSHTASCLTFWYFCAIKGQLTVSLLVNGKSQEIWPLEIEPPTRPWTEVSVSLPGGTDKFQVPICSFYLFLQPQASVASVSLDFIVTA